MPKRPPIMSLPTPTARPDSPGAGRTSHPSTTPAPPPRRCSPAGPGNSGAHPAPRLRTARATGHQAALPGEASPRPQRHHTTQHSQTQSMPPHPLSLAAAQTEPDDPRADYRYEVASASRAESAIWSAIHVTGGSANAALGRLPYAPAKVSSAGWGGATATVCSRPPSSAGCVEVTARRRSSARAADSSSWNAAARSLRWRGR